MPWSTACVCSYLLSITVFNLLHCVDYQVSLELHHEHCSDQLTLTCTHSEAVTSPNWVYNGTSAGGVALDNIPGANYTKTTPTRHFAVISVMANVMAVDSFTFQCVFSQLNNSQARSNEKQYYWGKLTLNLTMKNSFIYTYHAQSGLTMCLRELPCLPIIAYIRKVGFSDFSV